MRRKPTQECFSVVCLFVACFILAAAAAPAQNAAQATAAAAAQNSQTTTSPSPAKIALPSSYWAWQSPSGRAPSYSVIIPAHNTAPRIVDTLKSVEASIQYFKKNGGQQFPAEVVIVDDASTDNTLAKVLAFTEHRKLQNTSDIRWKVISMQQNVLGGAARNFGVRESTGDVLFFCDSDDLYLERHIAVGFSSLLRKPSAAMIQTRAKIELDNIHPVWKEKVEGTIPLTRCLWRKVHDFVEGYPEQGVFTRHQDVGYLFSFAALNVPMAVAGEETVVYKRYPGNSLDQQAIKFSMDPKQSPKSAEELTEETPIRMSLIDLHKEHLKAKLSKLLNGKQLSTDPLWAIYQHAADQTPNYLELLDVPKTKFRSLVDAAEHYTFAGDQDEAKQIFNILHKFVYNATEVTLNLPGQLYYVYS